MTSRKRYNYEPMANDTVEKRQRKNAEAMAHRDRLQRGHELRAVVHGAPAPRRQRNADFQVDRVVHADNSQRNVKLKVKKTTAVHGLVVDYNVTTDEPIEDIQSAIQDLRVESFHQLKADEARLGSYWLTLSMVVQFVNHLSRETFKSGLNSFRALVTGPSTLPSAIDSCVNTLLANIETFSKNGSGWSVDGVVSCQIQCCAREQQHTTVLSSSGGGGGSYVRLTGIMYDKVRAVANPENYGDNNCLLWCCESEDVKSHPGRLKEVRLAVKKRGGHKYDWTGVNMPPQEDDFIRFERQNNVFVQVFEHDRQRDVLVLVRAARAFGSDRSKHVINLVLVNGHPMLNKTTEDLNSWTSHYVIVRNLHKLLCSSKHAKKFCHFCRRGFTSQALLTKHLAHESCEVGFSITKVITKPNTSLSFNSIDKMAEPGYRAYATRLGAGYNLLVRCSYDQKFQYKHDYVDAASLMRGLEIFVEPMCIVHRLGFIKRHGFNHHKIDRRNMDHKAHKAAKDCYLCTLPFQGAYRPGFGDTAEDKKLNMKKVADHAHERATHNYLGPAHSICNINRRCGFYKRGPSFHWFISVVLPVLDELCGRLIASSRRVSTGLSSVQCIPSPDGGYSSITWGRFRFLSAAGFDVVAGTNIADEFDRFRSTVLEHFQLEPLHFFTTSGLAEKCALRQLPLVTVGGAVQQQAIQCMTDKA